MHALPRRCGRVQWRFICAKILPIGSRWPCRIRQSNFRSSGKLCLTHCKVEAHFSLASWFGARGCCHLKLKMLYRSLRLSVWLLQTVSTDCALCSCLRTSVRRSAGKLPNAVAEQTSQASSSQVAGRCCLEAAALLAL